MNWPLAIPSLSTTPTLDTFPLLFLHPLVLWGFLGVFYNFGERELWGRTVVFTLTLFIFSAYLQQEWPPFNSALNAAGEEAHIFSNWIPSVGVIIMAGLCAWIAWETKNKGLKIICGMCLAYYSYALYIHAPISWQAYVGSLLIVVLALLVFDIVSVRLAAKYPQITGFIISAGTIYLILTQHMEYPFVYAIQGALIGFTLGWMINGNESVGKRFSLAHVYRFLILGFGSTLVWMLLTMIESLCEPLTYAAILGFLFALWITLGVHTTARFYGK
ncbi:MAG: hypothetical protein H6849_05160 [Alphaproteobacteria bacterium]|nr:MAG: hypothetical protein H6849_05160 [Alphaproteobacteria bacterium]